MAHPARFERAIPAFGGRCSIQLSHGCSFDYYKCFATKCKVSLTAGRGVVSVPQQSVQGYLWFTYRIQKSKATHNCTTVYPTLHCVFVIIHMLVIVVWVVINISCIYLPRSGLKYAGEISEIWRWISVACL